MFDISRVLLIHGSMMMFARHGHAVCRIWEAVPGVFNDAVLSLRKWVQSDPPSTWGIRASAAPVALVRHGPM